MDPKKLILRFVKVLIFILFLLIFALLFLKDYLTNYLKSSTTFSSSYEKVENLEFPTIIACVQLGYREDILEKYNFENVYDFPGKEAENVSQMFDEVTFAHGIDYDIFLEAPIQFQRSDILTFGNGKCHKIQPIQEIAATQTVTLEFIWKEESEPKEIVIYLFSNNR